MYFGHYYKADVLPEYENTLSVLSFGHIRQTKTINAIVNIPRFK